VRLEANNKPYVHRKFEIFWTNIASIKIGQKTALVLSGLTPKGPMSVDGFLESSGRLSWHQKHERSAEILKEGGPM
jgi:hypothetical protein